MFECLNFCWVAWKDIPSVVVKGMLQDLESTLKTQNPSLENAHEFSNVLSCLATLLSSAAATKNLEGQVYEKTLKIIEYIIKGAIWLRSVISQVETQKGSADKKIETFEKIIEKVIFIYFNYYFYHIFQR